MAKVIITPFGQNTNPVSVIFDSFFKGQFKDQLRIVFSISMYIMCVMFVQRFEPQGRHFTNCYYSYNRQ